MKADADHAIVAAIDRELRELPYGFLLLVGHRAGYIPRKPVLFGQLIQLRKERERVTPAANRPQEAAPSERESLSKALDEALVPAPDTKRRGFMPRSREPRLCDVCLKRFVPGTLTQECCTKQCASKLRWQRRREHSAKVGVPVGELPVSAAVKARRKANIAAGLAETRASIQQMKAPPAMRECAVCPQSFPVRSDRPDQKTCSRKCSGLQAQLHGLRADLARHNGSR